ncbi:hypothetical protein M1B78_09810 [Bacteroides sp. KH569_7]|uniref:Uncharacterized protein n=1 Tax=Bacteroides muris (ex Fokt et al. 2023) TaxID=2937417 RepID=A0A9X2P0P9_9BACE|nr:hypothetical protein [Bacteroides muris (ex Fokt et al. 2023)]MCR6508451.1 hypothetical protein [Bacteroides muris (ex Fokt et al. 2023)]
MNKYLCRLSVIGQLSAQYRTGWQTLASVVTDTGLCRDRYWCLLRQALAFVIGLSGGLGASACFLKSP